MIYEEFLLKENDLFIYDRKEGKLFQQVGPDCLEVKDPGTMGNILTSNATVLSQEQAMTYRKNHATA